MDATTKRFRKTSLLLATVCLSLTGGPLQAGESPWYVAVRLGESSAEAQFGSRHPKLIDDEASTAGVEVGYEVNRFLAVEAGYLDLGGHAGRGAPCAETDDSCIERLAALELCVEGSRCAEIVAAAEAEISGFSLALVPSLPLGERLSLRGKLGLIAWDGDVTFPRFEVSDRFSGEGLVAGVGLEYSFPNGMGVLLLHEELELDVASTSLGVSWRF